MPKLIFSVCGPSAVGKATLIRNLQGNGGFTNDSLIKLRSVFRLPESRISTLGMGDHFSSTLKVPEFDPDAVVLHKWQTNAKGVLAEIDELQRVFQGVEHRIVFLWLPWKQWWHGFRAKFPANTGESMCGAVKWIYEAVLPPFRHNPYGIEVEHYHWHYPDIGGPPEYSRLAEHPPRP